MVTLKKSQTSLCNTNFNIAYRMCTSYTKQNVRPVFLMWFTFFKKLNFIRF